MTDQPENPRPDETEEEVQPRSDELLQSILHPKCDLCGSMMLESHCKLICPMCGYQRDCSDP